jgi:hypothetical protein
VVGAFRWVAWRYGPSRAETLGSYLQTPTALLRLLASWPCLMTMGWSSWCQFGRLRLCGEAGFRNRVAGQKLALRRRDVAGTGVTDCCIGFAQ